MQFALQIDTDCFNYVIMSSCYIIVLMCMPDEPIHMTGHVYRHFVIIFTVHVQVWKSWSEKRQLHVQILKKNFHILPCSIGILKLVRIICQKLLRVCLNQYTLKV